MNTIPPQCRLFHDMIWTQCGATGVRVPSWFVSIVVSLQDVQLVADFFWFPRVGRLATVKIILTKKAYWTQYFKYQTNSPKGATRCFTTPRRATVVLRLRVVICVLSLRHSIDCTTVLRHGRMVEPALVSGQQHLSEWYWWNVVHSFFFGLPFCQERMLTFVSWIFSCTQPVLDRQWNLKTVQKRRMRRKEIRGQSFIPKKPWTWSKRWYTSTQNN